MTSVGTQPVWKSSARLADGREIIYFDEAPGLGRALARDTRELPSRPVAAALPTGRPEWGIRWDPLAGKWVVIAAARQDRTFLPPLDQCPLDPSAPGRPTEIPADSYDVVRLSARAGSRGRGRRHPRGGRRHVRAARLARAAVPGRRAVGQRAAAVVTVVSQANVAVGDEAEKLAGELAELRHSIHREPEIGLYLPKTR
jgi:hypothetical protein